MFSCYTCEDSLSSIWAQLRRFIDENLVAQIVKHIFEFMIIITIVKYLMLDAKLEENI